MHRKGFTVVELLYSVVIIAVLLLVLAAPVEAFNQSKLERFCLSHGYARADWRWVGDNYCINRTDQTDVVVPEYKVK